MKLSRLVDTQTYMYIVKRYYSNYTAILSVSLLCHSCITEPLLYVFRLHDIDNNTRLDGLEIYNALAHYIPYEEVNDKEKIVVNKIGKSPAQIAQEERDAQEKYYSSKFVQY